SIAVGSWLNFLRNGGDPDDMIATLLTDPSVTNPQTRASYVQMLYNKILGRNGSVSEVNFWVNEIAGGGTSTSLSNVVHSFPHSTENRQRTLDGMYAQLLKRPIDSASESLYLNMLANGTTTFRQIAITILTSAEFRNNAH